MSALALTPEKQAAQAAAAAAAEQFTIEAFTLLGVGLLITILRTYARIRSVGVKRLQVDDYLIWFAVTCYAVETALAYNVGHAAHGLANNGMTPKERTALSPDSPEFALRILGSKIQLAGWTVYGTLLWALKGSLLVFYTRLTAGLGRDYEIRIYIGYVLVIVSYLIVIINLFSGCRPFHRYWQINPDPRNVCQPAVSAQIVWVYFGFNVTTDMYLLSIPLPMLWKASLRLLKKAGLMVLFGGGVFVIACATLRCVLIVTDPVHGAQLAGSWAVRETFVALATTNLPMVYPLFSTLVSRHISSWVSTARSTRKLDDNETPIGSELTTIGHKSPRSTSKAKPLTNVTFSESEERMLGVPELHNHDAKSDASSAKKGSHDHGLGHGVNVQKDVQIAVVCQERTGKDTNDDLRRQQATADLEESKRHQGHFAFARGQGGGEV